MDKEWKQIWVSALLSGEYQQGRNQLQNLDGSACCLGVLCLEAVKRNLVQSYQTSSGTNFVFKTSNTQLNPPLKFMEYLGISENEWVKLTELNDIDELSFSEISKWIEENL